MNETDERRYVKLLGELLDPERIKRVYMRDLYGLERDVKALYSKMTPQEQAAFCRVLTGFLRRGLAERNDHLVACSLTLCWHAEIPLSPSALQDVVENGKWFWEPMTTPGGDSDLVHLLLALGRMKVKGAASFVREVATNPPPPDLYDQLTRVATRALARIDPAAAVEFLPALVRRLERASSPYTTSIVTEVMADLVVENGQKILPPLAGSLRPLGRQTVEMLAAALEEHLHYRASRAMAPSDAHGLAGKLRELMAGRGES